MILKENRPSRYILRDWNKEHKFQDRYILMIQRVMAYYHVNIEGFLKLDGDDFMKVKNIGVKNAWELLKIQDVMIKEWNKT